MSDDYTGAINPTTREHQIFIVDEVLLKPRFLGRFVIQVPMGERWLIYRNGVLEKQLGAGRHKWWSGFFQEWRAQRVNTRIELLEQEVTGRVKGPNVPQEPGKYSTINLACDVKALFRLSVQIKNAETFMQFKDPITVFRSALRDLVIEFIGQLEYDQNGNWATSLREKIRNAFLGGRYNAELRLGLDIKEIFVVKIEPNSTYDRQVLEMYRLIERGKRELTEAVDAQKRDAVTARSFAEQGEILGIAPSILKLQDSPIGQALIEQDAELRKLQIAAGLNPGISIQPLQENPDPFANPQPATNVYLNPPAPPRPQIAPASNAFAQPAGPTSGPLPPYGHEITGSLATTGNPGRQNPGTPLPGTQSSTMPFPGQQQPASAFPNTPPPFLPASEEPAVDETRQTLELAELEKAGFNAAGRGQIVAATNEWTLMVYKRRPNGILTIAFTCPPGYPNIAPRVQVRTSAGGGYSNVEPNSIHGWQAHRLLADVATELLGTTL
jgi:hypothetical protein